MNIIKIITTENKKAPRICIYVDFWGFFTCSYKCSYKCCYKCSYKCCYKCSYKCSYKCCCK